MTKVEYVSMAVLVGLVWWESKSPVLAFLVLACGLLYGLLYETRQAHTTLKAIAEKLKIEHL
ncbi:MAG: hypothetical protein ABSH01_09685 [Terriglobia bacterium]|jgi:hypothetical protein